MDREAQRRHFRFLINLIDEEEEEEEEDDFSSGDLIASGAQPSWAFQFEALGWLRRTDRPHCWLNRLNQEPVVFLI